MKKLFVTLSLLAGLSAATVAQNNRNSWAYTITPKTTKAQLDSVAAAWAPHGIVLSFSQLTFNSKGTKLQEVTGNIDVTIGDQHMSSQITQQKVKSSIVIKINSKPSIDIHSK